MSKLCVILFAHAAEMGVAQLIIQIQIKWMDGFVNVRDLEE
jgi:hypothetical protein